MINSIIFDCGGVILSNAWTEGGDLQYNIIPEKLGISEEIAVKIFHKNWPDISIGKKSGDVFFNDLLTIAKNKIPLQELIEIYYRCIQKKDAFELVEKLYQKYPLYTLNDESKEWMDMRIRKFNLTKYFRDFITSGYVGYAKPNRRIYEILLERTRLKPTECLFIDNKEHLLSPAREIGYETILFLNKQQLDMGLRAYDIKI
ncbi:MAG: HAD family hydrolase [archaeon]